jgi:hydrogenase maturation protein HypF
MNTLSAMAAEMVKKVSRETNISEVVLSGGVFQNMYLLKRLKTELESHGFKVYTHNRVSTNDEGIALGQLLIAQNGGSVKCV